MNNAKMTDIMRKRNAELTQENIRLSEQVKMIQEKLDQIAICDEHSEIKMKVRELENIKEKWSLLIDELEEQKIKYNNLIHDLQIVKDIIVQRKRNIPWHKKLVNMFRKV